MAWDKEEVSYCEVLAIPVEAETIVPIGRPVHNMRLYLLNRWLEPVPAGVPGEICVAGIQVGHGYLDRPDLAAEKFILNPFNETGCRMYRTGDLGRYREDGAVEFLERINHQVRIRGVRIEPSEIEAQLLTFPNIKTSLGHGQGRRRLLRQDVSVLCRIRQTIPQQRCRVVRTYRFPTDCDTSAVPGSRKTARTLSYSLTRLLAYSLTRLLAYSLTRLLAYSLTRLPAYPMQ